MSLGLSRVARGLAPSATLQINAAVSLLKSKGVPVISLGAGEPDFNPPEHICAAAKAAIDSGQNRYTDVGGILPLRQAICDHIKNQKGLHYAADEVIVGSGAKQVICEALQAILDPGDEVLLPVPCWVSYPDMIRMAGGAPVLVQTDQKEGFLPTAERLAAAVTRRTKALIINTPGNPTGAVFSKNLLSEIMHLAQKHNLYVISDEIYENFLYDGAPHFSPAAVSCDAFQRTIVISGLSKSYAMTGWRVGYAAGPQCVIAAMTALQSHLSGNINTIAQHAALAALTGDQTCVKQFADIFSRRRQLLLSVLADEHLEPAVIPQGAFYLLLDVRSFLGTDLPDDIAFAQSLLHAAHVAVVPGAAFHAPGFVRISYAVHDAQIEEAVRRISAFIKTLK